MLDVLDDIIESAPPARGAPPSSLDDIVDAAPAAPVGSQMSAPSKPAPPAWPPDDSAEFQRQQGIREGAKKNLGILGTAARSNALTSLGLPNAGEVYDKVFPPVNGKSGFEQASEFARRIGRTPAELLDFVLTPEGAAATVGFAGPAAIRAGIGAAFTTQMGSQLVPVPGVPGTGEVGKAAIQHPSGATIADAVKTGLMAGAPLAHAGISELRSRPKSADFATPPEVAAAEPSAPVGKPAEAGAPKTPGEFGAPPAVEIPPPTPVERVSPATPNPPTAAIPTKPESPETIALQMQQLVGGQRKAVMFPKGTPPPDAYPSGVSITHDAFGNIYAYRPDLIKKGEITRAAAQNKLNTVLGATEGGMGAPDKSQLAGETAVVVGRTPEGVEAQATGTDAANLPLTVEAVKAVTPEGGSISVEPPGQTLAAREPVTPLEAPKPSASEPLPSAPPVVEPTPAIAEPIVPPAPAPAPEAPEPPAAMPAPAVAPAVAAPEETPAIGKPVLGLRYGQVTVERGPGWLGRIPTREITLDPATFQYKRLAGEGGAGPELRNVKVWDKQKAGTMSVWLDPKTGKTMGVNAHNRTVLAKRLKVPEVAVLYLDAKTAKEAYVQGALLNIAEGRGESIDAARVFRNSGMGLEDLEREGISEVGKIAQEGLAISKLAEPIYRDVMNGTLPPSRGAVIGDGLPNPKDQVALYSVVKNAERGGRRLTNDQIGEMIRLATSKTSPTVTETQTDLFGTREVQRSLLKERAEVSDYIRKQLETDKKLFGTVGTEAVAERLSEAGNIIQAAENAARATEANQGLVLYDKFSTLSGAVSDVLDEASRKLSKGKDAGETKRDAYRRIRDALSKAVGDFTRGQGASGKAIAGTTAEGDNKPGVRLGGASSEAGALKFGEESQPFNEPSLFGAEEQSQLVKESASYKARLLGERLTAQFKSGMAMKAPKLKPRTGATLFDKAPPEQQGLFGPLGKEGERGSFILRPASQPTATPPGPPPVPPAPPTPLAKLTEAMGTKPISEGPSAMDQAALGVHKTLASVSDTASRAWDAIQAAPKALLTAYTSPAKWTSFKAEVGKYQGQLQYGGWELKQFRDAIKTAIPDKLRREAITNYVQANGDMALLRERASASSAAHRPGYEAALKLNPAEVELATGVRKYFDQKLDEAQRLGMLKDGVNDYVNQVWGRDLNNPAAKSLRAAAAFHELQPNPSFLKKRIYDSYFEGEQAGKNPLDKDIGALIAAYDQSFNGAIASRAFIKSLHEGTASDGRPLVEVSGAGKRVEETPDDVSYFIKPKVKPEEALDYRVVDHPALRDWKWATADSDGKPIFVQGDMLVHPEVRQHLQNILGHSAVRDYALGRGALALSNGFKQTLLSLSPFHQVQIGVHALEHTVNPLRAKALDLKDATQRALVDHGLVVADFHGMNEFAEGVSGTGLVAKIPLLGSKMAQYQDYLFRDYIPRVKMSMAEEALGRNRARYKGKLSEDQILELTANQANAAFGHLNYKLLGRNPTFQDAFRLVALAPDFLEARSRFVGQALKPWGREQARALALGAVAMATGKVIIGQITGEDQDWSLGNLFMVLIGGREYGLRTIQGDLVHLLSDPRMFVSNRLNPAFTKPILELMTGRDSFGRKRTSLQEFQDYFKTAVPIPFKGALPDQPQDFLTTLLQSTGVQSRKYASPAEDVIRAYYNDNPSVQPTEHSKAIRKVLQAAQAGDVEKARQIGRGLVASRQASYAEVRRALERGKKPAFATSFGNVPLAVSIKAFDVTTPEERKQVQRIMRDKLITARNRAPWNWTPEVRTLARKNFPAITPPRQQSAPTQDMGVPAAIQ